MSYKDAIIFLIRGSLTDVIGLKIPNYFRPTVLWLEDANLTVIPISASHPGFSQSQGIYLEPGSLNAVTWNRDINRDLWRKGANVIVRANTSLALDKSFTADRVVFFGDPAQPKSVQTIERDFLLQPNTEYTLWATIKLIEGTFSGNDRISVEGGIREPKSLNLSEVNPYPKKYRTIETQFRTLGSNAPSINFTNSLGDKMQWRITQIEGNTITVTANDAFSYTGVSLNELRGSRITIIGQGIFEIIGNTNLDSSVGVFQMEIKDLPIGTSLGDLCTVLPSDLQPVKVEIYAETNVSFDWGTIQIEPLSTRTSPIFQRENITTRSPINLVYLESPLRGLKDFALFWEIEFWRGIVNLADSGNFQVELSDRGIEVFWNGDRHAYLSENIPQKFALLIQVIDLDRELKIYLDGRLVFISPTSTSTIVETNAKLDLTNVGGIVSILELTVVERSLKDGNVTLQSLAGYEVAEIFTANRATSSELLTSSFIVNLPSISVPPGANLELPSTEVTTSSDSEPTTPSQSDEEAESTEVTEVPLLGAVTELAGKASIRFPFQPIDLQQIRAIGFNTLTLETVSAYRIGRAFIVNENSEDLAETKIVEVNTTHNTITIDTVEEEVFAVGDFIVQPQHETLISPHNYFVKFKESINNVCVDRKSKNGIVIANYNPRQVTVSPYLVVFL